MLDICPWSCVMGRLWDFGFRPSVRWNEVVAATEVLWRHCFTETRLEYSENIAKDTFCSRGKGNEKAARFDFWFSKLLKGNSVQKLASMSILI